MVIVHVPACPYCGEEDHVRLRTYSEADGSKWQRRVCCRCSESYLAIFEPMPQSGMSDSCDVIMPPSSPAERPRRQVDADQRYPHLPPARES